MNNTRQVIFSTIGSVVVFCLLNFLLHWPILVSAVLSLGTFAGIYLISKPRRKIGGLLIDELDNGEELKALMDDAYEDMVIIEKASRQIHNTSIKEQTVLLHQTGKNILEYLTKNPDRISAARRFFGYYLDTAREILEKYLSFQKSGLKTDDVRRVTQATQDALPVLNEAFEKQFNSLMENDIIDIEANIKLLKTNLEMDSPKIFKGE
ncbi:5-bromo-4-chloroindolyl phosphate hydrolysis family protein [Acetobacterium sp.]|uniref:5-bromo-4-chloroindolyl phosphate hydrolysis family protein n=1 Tax=Acetobacterium sp. TaxID=1872094 RepID=UPI0035933286